MEEEDQPSIKAAAKKQDQKTKDQLSFNDIDAFWLSRTLMNSFPDKMAEEQLELQKRLMSILKLDNPRECERKLFAVLGTEKYQLIH